MKRQIAKSLAYVALPKATFAALHPRKAAMTKAAAWAIDHASPRKRRRSTRLSAAPGVAAAAIAIPIGFWLGRRIGSWHDTGRNRTAV